jgi:long-chain fatty acid transport protein
METRISLKKIVVLAALIGSIAVPATGFATNGLFGLGYGARQVGIAGSGVAFPQDPLIASINPAGVVYLGEEMDIDIQYFSPKREYTIGGATPATVNSDSENFFIPSFGMSKPLDDVSSVGFAVYGNGGMNTDYSSQNTPFNAGTFGGGHTGVNYAQVFANLNYSRKFAEGKASWGIAAILNYSYLRMNGLATFAGFSFQSAKRIVFIR